MAANTEENKQTGRKGLILLVLLLMVMAVIVLLLRPAPKPSGGLDYEANVVVGALPGKTEEERIAELNEMVAEGQVAISINATPCTAADGSGQVNWNIENPPNQGKLIRVEVSRNDTGDKVFETGAMKPGTYLPLGKLTADVAPGTYECTAMFFTYRLETEEFIGKGGAIVQLTVG